MVPASHPSAGIGLGTDRNGTGTLVSADGLIITVNYMLMGAQSVISGVRPETAQAMVHLGIDIGTVKSRSTLRDALQLAFRMLSEHATTAPVSTNGKGPGVRDPAS